MKENQTKIPIFGFKGEPLSKENSEYLISLFLNQKNEKSLDQITLKDEFLSQIFLKRIKVYNLKFVISDFFFVICLLTFVRDPGKVMILLRLCYQYWKMTGKNFIGINDFAEMFPFGTPSNQELKKIWESQKRKNYKSGESDNLLDYPELWP